MTKQQIVEERARIVREHGPWTAHNVHLGHDIYTIDDQWKGPHPRVEKIVQTIADLTGGDLAKVRVLDLACLEGLLAIECALQGAEAVGIEIRDDSLAKANFAKRALGLERLTFAQDDVLRITPEKYGQFDVVVCAGIFYHFDAPALLPFLRLLHSLCTRAVIIDTHFSYEAPESFEAEGRRYFGRSYREHAKGLTPEEKVQNKWASFENEFSFLPTAPSLVSLIGDAGFTSVLESHVPVHQHLTQDRAIYVGIKGRRVQPANWPLAPDFPRMRRPEVEDRPRVTVWPNQVDVVNPSTRRI